ncbi:deSI-like protein [Tanacetum coccineum]
MVLIQPLYNSTAYQGPAVTALLHSTGRLNMKGLGVTRINEGIHGFFPKAIEVTSKHPPLHLFLSKDPLIHTLKGYDMEYASGAHEYSPSGVFEVEPKSCPAFIFRRSIPLGSTNMSPTEFRKNGKYQYTYLGMWPNRSCRIVIKNMPSVFRTTGHLACRDKVYFAPDEAHAAIVLVLYQLSYIVSYFHVPVLLEECAIDLLSIATDFSFDSPDEERTSEDAVESPYMGTIRSKGITQLLLLGALDIIQKSYWRKLRDHVSDIHGVDRIVLLRALNLLEKTSASHTFFAIHCSL